MVRFAVFSTEPRIRSYPFDAGSLRLLRAAVHGKRERRRGGFILTIFRDGRHDRIWLAPPDLDDECRDGVFEAMMSTGPIPKMSHLVG
jgi:hypothetical protein